MILIFFIHLCLTKRLEIDPLEFYLVCGTDPTKLTVILKCLNRNGLPILVTLISFWHFAIVRQQTLLPSIAFTSILGDCQISFVRGVMTDTTFYAVFSEMKYALSALPETFINMLQVCSLLLPTYMYSHRFFRASSPFVVLKRILTVPKYMLSLLSTSSPKPSHSDPVP